MDDDTTSKKKKGQKILIISVVLVVLVGAFLLNLFFSQNKQQQKPQKQTPESIHLVPKPSSKETKVPGQLVVKFKKGVTDAQINSILSVNGAKIKSKISGINSLVIEVPKGQEDAILQKLKAESLVEYSEPDFIQKVNFVPNDPDFVNQWFLKNTGQAIGTGATRGISGVDIGVEDAWNVTQGGVKIAIIDTGIDTTHPDLAGKVVAQKVFVTSSIDDKYGHGTHVAGIIAANTNNGVGVAGVCPSCQLIIVKAMDDQGLGETSTLASAITWAADNGAKVINLSEGGAEKSQAQADAIAYAWTKGVVVVAAAGNDNSVAPFYPAALTDENVISVAATNSSDERASFSNFGTWVSVAAPGVNIFSTLPTYDFGMQLEAPLSLRYEYLSGTSMAAPIVSGIAGLVWATQYGTTNASVRDRILNNVDKIAGTGDSWVYGRVNASLAVGQAPAGVTATAAPTAGVTQPVGVTVSPATQITPTIFCLGAVDCGATTPTTAPDGTNPTGTDVTTEPGGDTITTIPGDGTIDTTTPTVDPCSTTESTVSVQHRHHHHSRHHSFDGFLKFLIDLINKLIALLGGKGTIPLPTDPCITPSPTETEPTVAPTTGEEVSPTTGTEEPTTTTAPGVTTTVAPTSGASTNATMDRISAYGWPDNSPAGAGIAYKGLHSLAGGTGTFADPITFAVADGSKDIMPPGMKVYIPVFKKYFIMEDGCAGCVRMQMDLWAGGDGSNDDAVLACEGIINRDNIPVELNAPDGREVDATPFVNASGACSSPGGGN